MIVSVIIFTFSLCYFLSACDSFTVSIHPSHPITDGTTKVNEVCDVLFVKFAELEYCTEVCIFMKLSLE